MPRRIVQAPEQTGPSFRAPHRRRKSLNPRRKVLAIAPSPKKADPNRKRLNPDEMRKALQLAQRTMGARVSHNSLLVEAKRIAARHTGMLPSIGLQQQWAELVLHQYDLAGPVPNGSGSGRGSGSRSGKGSGSGRGSGSRRGSGSGSGSGSGRGSAHVAKKLQGCIQQLQKLVRSLKPGRDDVPFPGAEAVQVYKWNAQPCPSPDAVRPHPWPWEPPEQY
jgi:hypothetical protein